MAEKKDSCDHNCSNCGEQGCSSRDLHVDLHKGCKVNKVIGIVSGKGGVGKSLVTSLLAVKMNKKGFRSAVLDADITGPSIPSMFGRTEEKATGSDNVINPIVTEKGIQLMSMNFLLEKSTDPVIWRGPIIAGAVKQFWTDVKWDNVDYMFVDMPPGTGDVPLTVFQSLPVDGIIVVASPQQLVRVIVEKAVNMAQTMNIPIIGLIENMSYVKCPECGKQINIYGESNIENIAKGYNLPVLGRIPIEEAVSRAVDAGDVESIDSEYITKAADLIEKI